MPEMIARIAESTRLEKIYDSHKAELIAVYGRRRVGKTFIIRHLFKHRKYYFEFSGIHKANMKTQLHNFATTISETFYDGSYLPECPDWLAAVTALRKALEQWPDKERIVLFFDELPWLVTPRSGALEAIEHLWNRYLSDDPRIMMILCGSAAAWMIRKVIRNRGGLHGRLSEQIRLLPFNLKETEHYLQAQQIHFDRKQIIELYFAFGGIAKYLSYIQRGKSVAQTINDLCFGATGAMHAEFNSIFQALFQHAERHIQIVKTLAKYPLGLSQKTLLEKSKIPTGGTASNVLMELTESGFIIQIQNFGQSIKNIIYQLSDEYSLFYQTWMQKQQQFYSGLPTEENYWQSVMSTQAWQSWCGIAFERLCLKHILQIKAALGIAAVKTIQSVWRFQKDSANQGTQIDLIIDRADNCINLCEIKFYHQPYQMTQKEAELISQRREIFRETTKTKKSVFNTLITTYGAIENDAYLRVIDNQITMNELFT